jgi:hypothetical protein
MQNKASVPQVGDINNAVVFRKVTSSIVTRVRKGIQGGGGHFEQLECSTAGL